MQLILAPYFSSKCKFTFALFRNWHSESTKVQGEKEAQIILLCNQIYTARSFPIQPYNLLECFLATTNSATKLHCQMGLKV